jgi:hypothetical protein
MCYVKNVFAGLLLLIVSNIACAQSYKITWALTGFSSGGINFPWLELDILETGRYLAAHGAILTENRQLSPASGTCVPTTDGYFCNLQIDRNSVFLTLDKQANGRLTGRDGSGNALPEATMTLHSVQ